MASIQKRLVVLLFLEALVNGTSLAVYFIIITGTFKAFVNINVAEMHNTGVNISNFWALTFIVLGAITSFTMNARIVVLQHVGESLTYSVHLKSLQTLLNQEVS
ncbi:hypothetical protein K502DRAFT_352675 [Neoconidiobolus thromboides FSU 785]|nr:hypothetical protein K502DRAFT_352675 [Neoconidiobolus thromboides FSU 785]